MDSPDPSPSSAPHLRARDLEVRYDTRPVLHGVDLDLRPGAVTVILGANASGKSTLLRSLARLLPPARGRIELDAREISRIPPKEFARRVALLPQSPEAPRAITVAELVARGRFPHQRLLQQWSAQDAEAVDRALRATGTGHLAGRHLEELSGGQRQRAWVAMMLAQDTPLLLMDEPTTALDVAHQLEVLGLVRRLNREQGRTVAMVLHDLDQACRFADELVVMHEGEVLDRGAPQQVMTPALLERAFGVRALVQEHPVTGTPLVLPLDSLTERHP